uniref:Uncharacterized protein n=1 Tax=Opuntia streptacantha TaxID=393608 RepID=A0A7C9CWX3_OPUST
MHPPCFWQIDDPGGQSASSELSCSFTFLVEFSLKCCQGHLSLLHLPRSSYMHRGLNGSIAPLNVYESILPKLTDFTTSSGQLAFSKVDSSSLFLGSNSSLMCISGENSCGSTICTSFNLDRHAAVIALLKTDDDEIIDADAISSA